MEDRYITSKEFRKLSMVTELLTERFRRKQIKWYCEKDGWSLLIDDKDAIIHVSLSEEEIKEKSVTQILMTIIGCL